MALLYLMETS